jgi:mannose-1-phosphate guanylyltransferase
MPKKTAGVHALSGGARAKKSIDYAVMERTKLAAGVPTDLGWSDIGSWSGEWDVMGVSPSALKLPFDVCLPAKGASCLRSASADLIVCAALTQQARVG